MTGTVFEDNKKYIGVFYYFHRGKLREKRFHRKSHFSVQYKNKKRYETVDAVITILKKLKGVHIGLFILGAIAILYLFTGVEKNRLEHLRNGGVLACGAEGKTEVIDDGYRVSPSGLSLLSKTGKKWKVKGCTPFPAKSVK